MGIKKLNKKLKTESFPEGENGQPLMPWEKDLSKLDRLELIEELKVRQVELELQNEELTFARNLEENLKNKFKELYDSAPIGYLTIDKFYIISQINLRGAKFIGKNRTKAKLSDFRIFISNEDKESFVIFIENIFRKTRSGRIEVQLVGNDGIPKDVMIEGVLSENDKECYLVIVDLTKEKENLENIRINKAKSDFIITMGHELRTPLNSILGYSDILITEFFGKLNEKQMSQINLIKESGLHLLDLITSIFDISKIEAGIIKLNLEIVPLSTLISHSISLIATDIESKKIELKTNLRKNLFTKVDFTRASQIIINILSNAIKYTPDENGIIIINTEKIDDEMLRVSIIDNGIGIPVEDQKKIFYEFHQVDKIRDGNLGGSGLGLSISKRLVEKHGGELGLISEEGKGCCFWFTLPLASEEGSWDLKNHFEEIPLENVKLKGKILIAEDDILNMDVICKQIEIISQDLQILKARNGEEAVQMAMKYQPDLIFMDIQMPVMNGLDATKIIRRNPVFTKLPIISVSAVGNILAKDPSFFTGLTERLIKPVKLIKLKAILIKYLGKK